MKHLYPCNITFALLSAQEKKGSNADDSITTRLGKSGLYSRIFT